MNQYIADHSRIINHAIKWRGDRMALATVVETWRSAPCPVGTHMLIHEDGSFVGSVSGGCVEGDVLHLAADIIAGAPFTIRRYGIADGAAWQVGLPCGGDIVVILQPVSKDGFAEQYFQEIKMAQASGKVIKLTTNLDTGITTLFDIASKRHFTNVYLPARRLLIIGAVEIAVSLSAIARDMGMGVTIIDPRARYLTKDRFPGVALDDRWPDEAIAAHHPDARTAIITLSHDPKIDDPALIAALKSPAGYIAALGSRASHAKRCERLLAAGINSHDLERIEGPAGVIINAISACEIALSIAGGMIRTFNQGLR